MTEALRSLLSAAPANLTDMTNVEITEEQQYRLLSDPSTGQTAPLVLWRPMSRLAGGGRQVTVSACSCVVRGNTTHWAVAWLTSTHIVYGLAVKDHQGVWSAYSDDQSCEPGTVTVWARGLDQLVSLEAVEPAVDAPGNEGWVWTEAYALRFADGAQLSLPLFPDLSGGIVAGQPALELFDALVARVGGAE